MLHLTKSDFFNKVSQGAPAIVGKARDSSFIITNSLFQIGQFPLELEHLGTRMSGSLKNRTCVIGRATSRKKFFCAAVGCGASLRGYNLPSHYLRFVYAGYE